MRRLHFLDNNIILDTDSNGTPMYQTACGEKFWDIPGWLTRVPQEVGCSTCIPLARKSISELWDEL